MIENQDLIIFSDGACSGNPGPGGWAFVIYNSEWLLEGAQQVLSTTNNRMEMTAAIEALKTFLNNKKFQNAQKIKIYTDSVYVIRGSTQWLFGWKRRGWKTAENNDVINQDLWIEMDQVLAAIKKRFPDVQVEWNYVRGHTGVTGNEICDQLAVKCSQGQYVQLYNGPFNQYGQDLQTLPSYTELPEMKKKGSSSDKKKEWYISYVDGVFSRHQTWPECERLVKGRKALFKKVSSEEEEQALKQKWGVTS